LAENASEEENLLPANVLLLNRDNAGVAGAVVVGAKPDPAPGNTNITTTAAAANVSHIVVPFGYCLI